MALTELFLRLYYVHNDLSNTVKVFYDLDKAELVTDQYCRVHEVNYNQAFPRAMAAYNLSHERFGPLYQALAG